MSDTPITDKLQNGSQWLSLETREALAWKHARDLERLLSAPGLDTLRWRSMVELPEKER